METHDDGIWGFKLSVAVEANNVEETVEGTGPDLSKTAPLSDSSWTELKIAVRILLCLRGQHVMKGVAICIVHCGQIIVTNDFVHKDGTQNTNRRQLILKCKVYLQYL